MHSLEIIYRIRSISGYGDTYLHKNIKSLRQNLNLSMISAGLIASIFGITGPSLIIIGGVTIGRLTYAQTIGWVFAVYFYCWLLGMFMSLKYRRL